MWGGGGAARNHEHSRELRWAIELNKSRKTVEEKKKGLRIKQLLKATI